MSVYPDGATVERTARISDDGLYRYALTRRWGRGEPLTFVMLNPSTADADNDDPTIRRCVGFALSHGYGGVRVLNLFGWRATSPAELRRVDDPVGPDSDDLLALIGHRAGVTGAQVVAAWGTNGPPDRVADVVRLLGVGLSCLGVTLGGAPRHPLYVASDARLKPWSP